MGANAQTTVPTFTASQVLTADQMNQSARTGVPVFASTGTRDAGFGGAGEKTLAEGQLCYVEGTGLQSYNGTTWITWGTTPKLFQTQTTTTSTQTTSASTTYADTSLSLSITPSATSSKILIMISGVVEKTSGDANNGAKIRLMRDSTAIYVIGDGLGYTGTAIGNVVGYSCAYVDSPNTTSAVTYKTQLANLVAANLVKLNTNTSVTSIVLQEIV